MENHRKNVSVPTMKQVESERDRAKYKKRFTKTLTNTISVLLVVAAIAVLISTMFLPVIQVAGNSMEPTLTDGDILVLVKSKNYKRGDICCVSWQNKKLLKRVIGLPGDYILIDDEGNVYVNDELLEEEYVTGKAKGICDIDFPYQVPDKKLFVLGDHRSTSIDSRSATIGCVGNDQILGHVLFKVWPLKLINAENK